MKKALSLSILLFFAFALHAANLYVSTLGNDAADGLSWSNAKECVQAAISAAQSGDTVFVAAGLYAQRIVMSNGVHVFGGYDATTGKRDILANMTILDGTSLQNRLVDASAHFSMVTYVDGLVLQNANHSVRGGAAELSRNVVMNQCTIRQCVTNKGGGGVYNNGGRVVNCVIELCEALDAGGGVHNYGGVVENCIIRGCKGKYGAIRNEMNGVVRNCLVHNNEPSTTAWPNSGGIYNPSGVVYNNTLACNYGSQYAGFHSDNIAYNNLMWNNQSEEGFADPANFVSGEKTKNGSGHNAADFYFDAENFTVYLGVDNMASDGPHFVAPTLYVGAPKNDAEIAAMRAANFSLMAGSPVIDRAKMGLDLAYDIDNNPRPVNGRADIG